MNHMSSLLLGWAFEKRSPFREHSFFKQMNAPLRRLERLESMGGRYNQHVIIINVNVDCTVAD